MILLTLSSAQIVWAYENTDYGFTFTPPVGWQQTEDEPGRVGYVSEDETVSMGISVDETNDTLVDYAKLTEDSMDYSFTDYLMVTENPMKIGSLNGYYIVFTGLSDQDSLKGKMVLLVDNGKAFSFLYLAFEAGYDSHLSEFDQSVQTFSLSNTNPVVSTPDSTTTTIIITIVAVVVALAVVLFLWRRKGKAKAAQLSQASNPPPPPPPP